MSEPTEPSNDFTIPQQQPAGLRIPEFAIRQLIGWAIGQVRNTIGTPNDVVDQLFAVVPAGVRAQFKQWMLTNNNLFLEVGWPQDASHIAMIVVEPQSEEEDTENAFLNDAIGMTTRGTFGDVVPTESPAYAIPETRTTNIYVASQDDRLTLLLYELVKYVLVYNKQSLTKYYDVHNLRVSGGVVSQDDTKLPEFVHYRVLQARYMTLFDFNGPVAPTILSIDLAMQVNEPTNQVLGGLLVDTVQDGDQVVVKVPDAFG